MAIQRHTLSKVIGDGSVESTSDSTIHVIVLSIAMISEIAVNSSIQFSGISGNWAMRSAIAKIVFDAI